MSTKSMYKEMYAKKLDMLILREGNKFKYYLYRGNSEYNYYIHIKIPSEVVKSFYYDVVIEFSTANPALAVGRSLKDYDIKVFTNSPDFIFTHVHAYNKAKLFFEDMASKVPKISLKETAKERNPKDEIGYVKSIYFTYLIMIQNNLFEKLYYKTAPVYVKKNILLNIMSAEQKIALRQEEESKQKAELRRKKANEIKKDNEARSSKQSLSKGNVHKTPTTSRIGGVKSAKKSKRVNKI